jgi:hypothetical protein
MLRYIVDYRYIFGLIGEWRVKFDANLGSQVRKFEATLGYE